LAVGFFVGPDLFQGVAPTIDCYLAMRRPIQLRMEVLAYVIWFFGDFHEVLFGAGFPIGVVSPGNHQPGNLHTGLPTRYHEAIALDFLLDVYRRIIANARKMIRKVGI
jgi:hypothetical protein